MTIKHSLFRLLFVLVLLPGACSRQIEPRQGGEGVTPCQIVYDAGSSGTRLYIYELTGDGWLGHQGAVTGALADPVRAIRGKTMSDADSVIDDLIASLENIRGPGPLDKKGEPEWPGFDWRKRCNIDAVAVYATAGMRLAEQHDSDASKRLWKMLNDKLSASIGMSVLTRTLTGYEEGLFAWLAIREVLADGDFGLAEMGGASVQVTFPCRDCETSRHVRVKDAIVPVFSHSFLGLGQDEAWKKFGPLPACERGIGLENPNWKSIECVAGMPVSSDNVAEIKSHVLNTDDLDWYLSGAFRYMHNNDIDQFCREGMDSGFEQETSCFRAVYLDNVLDTLGLPEDAEPTSVDWTLGAVVCTATRCLKPARSDD